MSTDVGVQVSSLAPEKQSILSDGLLFCIVRRLECASKLPCPSRVFVNGPYGALTGVLHRRGDPCGRPAVRRVFYVFAPARPQNVGDCRRAAARAAPTVIDAGSRRGASPLAPPAGASFRGASHASAVTERGRRRGERPSQALSRQLSPRLSAGASQGLTGAGERKKTFPSEEGKAWSAAFPSHAPAPSTRVARLAPSALMSRVSPWEVNATFTASPRALRRSPISTTKLPFLTRISTVLTPLSR